MKLEDCHSILGLREIARRRLPSAVFDVMDGAAETEITARRNTSRFDDVELIPRYLVDVEHVSTSTQVLGKSVACPVICSPTGVTRLFHPSGELAVARAAAKASTWYSLSTAATCSIEEVAAVSTGPRIFQLFICKDRELTRTLVERAKDAGYGALCITINCPVGGKCERELRAGLFRPPLRWPMSTVLDLARHPSWVLQHLNSDTRTLANLADGDGRRAHLRLLGEQFDASITWKEVREITEWWNGPTVLKGVMSADVARRAADEGFSAVIVSNHGGRQLDGAIASIEALPDVVRAVGDRIEVILDGGIRRGVHVLKALALGAKACSIGRPYLYGLSAGGEEGVTKALTILRTELMRAMQLCGVRCVGEINDSVVRRSFRTPSVDV